MAPKNPLPLPIGFADADAYVDSLLYFISSSEYYQTFCGGVHILDFFTSEPDLYSTILPASWREWFRHKDVPDVLDVFLRADLSSAGDGGQHDKERKWRDDIPESLLGYIKSIRKHSLRRDFAQTTVPPMSRQVSVGMKPKKIHEVECFASYVDQLASNIAKRDDEISHLVDFGSGRNYLGRALASPPYGKHLVAVESRSGNIEGARIMDISAKLAEKEKVMRDKRLYRMQDPNKNSRAFLRERDIGKDEMLGPKLKDASPKEQPEMDGLDAFDETEKGSIQYVENQIMDGDLSQITNQLSSRRTPSHGPCNQSPRLMVISLHSCGNLIHHGLRSLILNPSVVAVALIGCCYNLMTERLGPPTYKLPSLRPANERVRRESGAFDPHGFPMSERLARLPIQGGQGVHMNITARMMAVQAPENWTQAESEGFFTRHFFRALLQRIFVDRGVVGPLGPLPADEHAGGQAPTASGGSRSVIIGSLRKACYASFSAYVWGAVNKLMKSHEHGAWIGERMSSLTDAEIADYEARYSHSKQELSIVWSLMAFTAIVAESVIFVDRWCFLKEQDEVEDCWVEPVFSYESSPRNLVVVGVKKRS